MYYLYQKKEVMKMNTIAELNKKMILIAESNNLTIEQFKKLPRKKFIAMCNKYNNK